MCSAITPPKEKTCFSGGTLSYEEYYNLIKKEAAFLHENAPASMVFLLGFQTLPETKYAIYALKEISDLPICVLLDFKGDTNLSDDFQVASATITLQSLGISAIGVMADDCDTTLDILLDMKEFASVPLLAFPGANTQITPSEYAEYAHDFINNKCVMFCAGKGTDFRHTAQIAKELWQLEPFMPDFPLVNAVCGKQEIYFMDFHDRVISTNKNLIEINLESITKLSEVDAVMQKLVDAGLPPVCFKTKEIDILEHAIKLYPGRAAIISDEYGEITAKEYGAVIMTEQKGEN